MQSSAQSQVAEFKVRVLSQRERENSEKEILSALDKNKQMRRELVELHAQLMDTREERDQFQRTVDGFDRSSGALEDVLKLATDLKANLRDAYTRLTVLQKENYDLKGSGTQTLFNELVENSPIAICTSITAKYELAQKEMGDHTSAMDNLIEISKYNYERFESLITKHQCGREASRPSGARRPLSPHSGHASPSPATVFVAQAQAHVLSQYYFSSRYSDLKSSTLVE
ncbi:hypothetical protein EVAR_47515_1 [Eumeta japonica]|uniref:Uncharacterized protein n=1 Tax=Eumeta variegata TaxID=151549 RepID=A0A4C1XV45_EUMVA|nr:hypothetical protein EVAR_47515_1 [Eumeta japonica]